jgi:hypothetical protein
MVDPAHRILVTTALRPGDGLPDLLGFIRGRGDKMRLVQLSD